MSVRSLRRRSILALAALGLGLSSSSVLGAGKAYLNIGTLFHGIARIVDLTAASGAQPGSVQLTWTEPKSNFATNPRFYDIRVSSAAQIGTDADFTAAQPLSNLSPSTIPPPGLGGGGAALLVTGLTPGVTYYFAIREQDSGLPPFTGAWLRYVARGWNVNNFAISDYNAGVPSAVTDLTASPTGNSGEIKLTWTAPGDFNGVPISSYTLRFNAQSVANLGGNTTAWFNLATSTSVTIVPVHSSGTLESLLIENLPNGAPIFFGIKSTDIDGDVSSIDVKANGVVNQANAAANGSINIFASTGAIPGSVSLTWTEPGTAGQTPPLSYVVHVSTTANFSDNAGFAAAQPLTAFSSSPPPPVGASGNVLAFTVTGLAPFTTYYFGVVERDSGGPPAFQTSWVRNAALSLSATNYAQATFAPGAPQGVTDLTALAGAVEGEVSLSWTSPPLGGNDVPLASYVVRFATFSAASLAGDTTAWFNASASSQIVVSPAVASGSSVTIRIAGLFPLSTWYFALKTIDQIGETSDIDTRTAYGTQAFTLPGNLPPATPAGLAATAGILKATVVWNDLTPAQKGLDFAFYKLYRSTQQASNFVQVTTTTGLSYLDKPLLPFVTYYYKLSGSEGPGGLDGVLSSTVSAVPFNIAPMEPFGINVAVTSATISMTWSPTVRYADGTLFASTSTPSVDELIGYRVLRSTGICESSFTVISSMTFAVEFASDTTNGNAYFYRIESVNSLGPSTSTLLITSLGDRNFMLDDCASDLIVPASIAPVMNANTNALGDIMIERRLRTEDHGDGIVTSAEFRPMLNGVTELRNYYLPQPAHIALHFNEAGGAPVTQGLGVESLAPQAASSVQNLGVFWNNGSQFVKMYGKVDALDQLVAVDSPNFGVYQVRTQVRSNSAVFDISNISGRVLTPNGDGLNDRIIFTYDPGPDNAVPTGEIFDLHGQHVANMALGLVPNTLVWDGMMNGRAVTSGVYVYQIKGDGKTFNGTIVVAR